MIRLKEQEEKERMEKEGLVTEIKVGYRVNLLQGVDWGPNVDYEGEPPNNELSGQLLKLANWIDGTSGEADDFGLYYYSKDLEDARKVRSKAIELYDKAGYNGKGLVHIVQQTILGEEVYTDIINLTYVDE
jgi:hypothetical protein